MAFFYQITMSYDKRLRRYKINTSTRALFPKFFQNPTTSSRWVKKSNKTPPLKCTPPPNGDGFLNLFTPLKFCRILSTRCSFDLSRQSASDGVLFSQIWGHIFSTFFPGKRIRWGKLGKKQLRERVTPKRPHWAT